MSSITRIFLLLLCLGSICIPAASYAQEREYKRGLYTRLQTGGGQGIFELQHLSKTNSRFTSISPFIAFQIGSVLAPNFILYAGISGVRSAQAQSGVPSHTSNDYSYTILTTGLNYYFMPYNIYVSPEIRVFGNARLSYEDSKGVKTENIFDSGTGYGLALGKEWPLNEFWNIGLAFTAYQDAFRGNRAREIKDNTVKGMNNFDNARSTLIGLALSISFHKF